MREIWRGALRLGGLLLKQREPQTDHRHVDTFVTVKAGLTKREAAADNTSERNIEFRGIQVDVWC